MYACGGVCVDEYTDNDNCGNCGVQCIGDTECFFGNCDPPCHGPGLELCGDQCIDTFTDPNNCGSCGSVCTEPGTTCDGGQCDCADLAETNCGDTCSDIDSDPNNCGNCGTVCDPSQSCNGGYCE